MGDLHKYIPYAFSRKEHFLWHLTLRFMFPDEVGVYGAPHTPSYLLGRPIYGRLLFLAFPRSSFLISAAGRASSRFIPRVRSSASATSSLEFCFFRDPAHELLDSFLSIDGCGRLVSFPSYPRTGTTRFVLIRVSPVDFVGFLQRVS